MADPIAEVPFQPKAEADRSSWALFNKAFMRDSRTFADSRIKALIADSAFNPDGYAEVFQDPKLGWQQKLSYVLGRIGHDVLSDGTRIPYWALNHPLAQLSVGGDAAAQAAGLSPNYDEWRKKLEKDDPAITRDGINARYSQKMGFAHPGNPESDGKIPFTIAEKAVPAMATAAMTLLSDNTNYLNLLQGGRTKGFQAVLPVEGSFTESANPLLELGARYIFGRTGRVLPWEAFTQERPDVSKEDYDSYVRYQFDKGPLDLGLLRGTSRNLDGEPEYTMLGYRVPFSAATAAAGTLIGATIGGNATANAVNGLLEGKIKLPKHEGPRRLAGAVVGGLLGAIGGDLTGNAVNDLVIQPTLNPDKLAAAEAWIAQQKAAGNL